MLPSSEQCKRIITVYQNRELAGSTKSELIKKEKIVVSSDEYNSVNNIENGEIAMAIRLYYQIVASGLFANKMMYAPANTDILIDRYNSINK